MAENLNLKTVDTVDTRPFKRLVMTIGELPTSFIESMTYYELLAWFVNYLETVIIPTVNNNAEATQELQDLFTELKNFVDNYFDNLDVQEEINNKLDAMAEDGTLAELLAKDAFKALNIADNYDIDYEKHTDISFPLIYHTTEIAPVEGKTTMVNLQGKLCSYDLTASAVDENRLNMFEYAKNGTNFVIGSNCDSGSALTHAVYIRDGEVLRGTASGTPYTVWGIKSDGDLKIYKKAENTTQMVTDGIQNSWAGTCIFYNGSMDTTTWDDAGTDITEVRHPRTIVLQESNSKNIVLIHVEGRKSSSVGVTFVEACALVQELYPNVNNALILGGGGDSQLMIDGRIRNDCSDYQLRPLNDLLYLDGNLNYSSYNEASLEIANARTTNFTLSNFVKQHVSLTENHLYADKIINLTVGKVEDDNLCLVGNLDYNVTLNPDEVVILKFPDMSSYNWNITVSMNIHYDTNAYSSTIRHQDGTVAQPLEISGKILYALWNGTNYVIIDNTVIQHTSGNVERDLDNFKTSGEYYSENFTNTPATLTHTNTTGLVKVSLLPDGKVIQVFQCLPTNDIFTRSFNGTNWSNWVLLDSNRSVSKNGLDANDCIGLYYHFYGNSITNKPAGTNNGWLINIPGTSGYNVQFYLEREQSTNTGRIYARFQENSIFGNWKQISFVS